MTAALASVRSSLRYLLADLIGDDGAEPPFLPEGLSPDAAAIVSDGIHLLLDYQGANYAQLYADRVRRFVGRHDVTEPMLCEIARLMALRMSYEDPIRIAQLKLAELEQSGGVKPKPQSHDDVRRFRFDELVGALPAVIAEPVLDTLEWIGWTHKTVSIRFSTRTRWGIRRLKIEALLRRWRQFSVRYVKERAWVERWLHMINRSLAKQPEAAAEIVQTATLIQGYGRSYRQGLADWDAIIDGLVKPTFDGVLPLTDLAGAIAKARAAAMPDPRQVALKGTIAEIAEHAHAAGAHVAG